MGKKVIILLSAFFLVTGCAITAGRTGRLKIIKYRTTQTKILDVFAVPDTITKNRKGNEIWIYNKVSLEKAVLKKGRTAVVATSKSSNPTNNETFTLTIEFNHKKRVYSYNLKETNIK